MNSAGKTARSKVPLQLLNLRQAAGEARESIRACDIRLNTKIDFDFIKSAEMKPQVHFPASHTC
jgi:hypothetical protein